MPTSTIYNRYTSDNGYEFVVGIDIDLNSQWELITIIRFKVGRTSGELVGLKELPWTIRQLLHDTYNTGL